MTILIAIDGGGSGCRAVVATTEGSPLGRGEGGPANIVSDPEGARASVLAASRAALEDAGLSREEPRAIAVLGLAGANISGKAEDFAASLPFAHAHVASDALMSLEGALGGGDGVTAAIGTGSVFGRRLRGETRFIGGWGFILSDHAGGARLGRALLETALLAHDGMAPRTPLLDAVLAEAGGPEGLVAFAARARPADFARHARRLAEADDPAAGIILAAATCEVSAAVDVLLADEALPLCFLGGLGPLFAARLALRYGALIRPPAGDALDGALATARRMLEGRA